MAKIQVKGNNEPKGNDKPKKEKPPDTRLTRAESIKIVRLLSTAHFKAVKKMTKLRAGVPEDCHLDTNLLEIQVMFVGAYEAVVDLLRDSKCEGDAVESHLRGGPDNMPTEQQLLNIERED